MASLQTWYKLTKPGIVYGNAWHFIAGGFVAMVSLEQIGQVAWGVFGTCLVVAAACVANNILDRDYDAAMSRTKKRAVASGDIKTSHAALFSTLLLVAGLAILLATSPVLVAALGLIGFVGYSFVYTYSKRTTIHSTLIGTIPGSIPVAAGYVVVNGELNMTALLLFLLVGAWQMTHFYAITIFRKDDYRAAGLPVLSVKRPYRRVWLEMTVYSLLYMVFAGLLVVNGSIQLATGLIIIVGGLWWTWQVYGGRGIKSKSKQVSWAKSVFGRSLLLALGLPAVMAIDFMLKSIAY